MSSDHAQHFTSLFSQSLFLSLFSCCHVQAIKAGDLPSVLEYTTLLTKSSTGNTPVPQGGSPAAVQPEVLAQIQSALASAASAPGVGPEGQALLATAALAPVAAKMAVAGAGGSEFCWYVAHCVLGRRTVNKSALKTKSASKETACACHCHSL
jgi:hypothetical protein